MIESHLPLVKAVAKRYAGRGAELDDLVQVGAIGLIKATDRFDPRRGVAFATFAAPTIEGEIRHHLRDRASALRIPRDIQRLAGEVRRHQGELEATLGRAPSLGELAAAAAADERDVERALAVQRDREPAPLPQGDDSSVPAEVPEPFADSDDRLLLADRMRALDDRERRIVYLRFHADKTERQIAGDLGISQAHVSRLLAGALEKLRHELGAEDDGLARPDITVKPVISPDASTRTPPQGEAAGDREAGGTATQPRSGHRIRSVTARADSTVARYLELPYHIIVRAQRDGARPSWSAVVEELPGCAARGDTPDEAVEQLRPAMEAWLTAAIADDRDIPRPNREAPKAKAAPSHSGRFLVRMPSELHEQLADAAEREQVSLNRFVTDVLAASIAGGPPGRPVEAAESATADGHAMPSQRSPAPRTLRVALAANLAVVVVAGLVAVALLVLALERGI